MPGSVGGKEEFDLSLERILLNLFVIPAKGIIQVA
jgi:hypothetical protein